MSRPYPGLTFEHLRAVNLARCRGGFFPLVTWSPVEWSNAMAGEAGEVCNLTKKALRKGGRDDTPPPDVCRAIADELADVITYADLLAARLGIDLGHAVARKFNEVSRRVDSSLRLDEGEE